MYKYNHYDVQNTKTQTHKLLNSFLMNEEPQIGHDDAQVHV